MPMTVGTGIGTDMTVAPESARDLEALGYDFVGIGETTHNPFLPLALVAEHTERMEFGTSVAIAFPRVPHISANIAWDLSKYSGGRFILGIGTQVKGHNERRFSVPWAPKLNSTPRGTPSWSSMRIKRVRLSSKGGVCSQRSLATWSSTS